MAAPRRPRRPTKSPGGSPPVYTGKGRKGTGLGYHGHPGGATKPAKGMGYHGDPPSYVTKGRRGPGPQPPKAPKGMVKPVAKPSRHRAGTRRAPGHNISLSKSK